MLLTRLSKLALLLAALLPFACGTDLTTSTVSDGGSCSDTWSGYAQSFFSTRCASCHGQFGSQASVLSYASAINSEISSGRMPEGSSLSSSEKTRILDWLVCGAQ
jgi:cytochrome c553